MMNILSAAATILLSLSHPDGIYQVGDTVKVYASLGDKTELVHSEVACEGPENRIFDYEDTQIGWVVAPQDYVQGVPCPKDFKRWWGKQLKAMRREKMEPVLREMSGVSDPDVICYELEINCIGDNPVRGYVAIPRAEREGGYPLVMYFHAAGVAGRWCRCWPEETISMAKWGNGAICVNINAFGMENGREQEYYNALEQGLYKDYSKRASESREDYFFKNMYLRAVRALDFACTLPQWDGKRVLAYGQSQGGAQAFALAGLDKRVSAVVGIVPGGCNSAGSARKAGFDSWPYTYKSFVNSQQGQKILSYFDGCNFLANTRAKLFVEIGLMDQTCRPSAIFSALNANSASRKGGCCGEGSSGLYGPEVTVLCSPWRYHDEPKPRYWEHWRDTIYTARMQWINDYLQ